MVSELFPSQTAQTLNLGSKLVPGRRYVIGVVGTAVAFDLQYSMPVVGLVNIQGYTTQTPASAATVLQVEIPLLVPALYINFSSAPGTYTVMVQEIKEQH